MSDGQSALNFENCVSGPKELLAETDLLLTKVIDEYRTSPATSPLQSLQRIMHECHDLFRVLILRFSQQALNQGGLLEAFDRVITEGGIYFDHKDRWISNTIVVAENVAQEYPKLKPALVAGIESDRLLRKNLREDVIAEIQAAFKRCEAPEKKEEEPDPWLAAAASMTHQPLPLGPQPTLIPPSGLPTGGAGRRGGRP